MNDEWTLKEAEAEVETVEVKVTPAAAHIPAAELRARQLAELDAGDRRGNELREAARVDGEHIHDITSCASTTRVKRNTLNHTIRCQKPAGHEGGHEAKAENRTTIWYGPVQQLQGDMRYRFGLAPGWQTARPANAGVMGGGHEGDW